MTIVDTGSLVALLNRADPYHEWAVAQTRLLPPPLTTCEAVLTETFFLIAPSQRAVSRLFDLLECEALSVDYARLIAYARRGKIYFNAESFFKSMRVSHPSRSVAGWRVVSTWTKKRPPATTQRTPV